jgi:hypothetical protein
MRSLWSRNPHAKTSIPGKPSKSGLIEVWHKDNLYMHMLSIFGFPHKNEKNTKKEIRARKGCWNTEKRPKLVEEV